MLDRVLSGDSSLLHDIELSKHLDFLLIGQTETETLPNETGLDLKSIALKITFQLISSSDGKHLKTFALETVGAHLREDLAEKLAWERAMNQLKSIELPLKL